MRTKILFILVFVFSTSMMLAQSGVDTCATFNSAALEKAILQGDSATMYTLYAKKAFCYAHNSNFPKAVVYGRIAYTWAPNDSLKLKLSLSLAGFYANSGILDSAYAVTQNGLNIAAKRKDKYFLFQAYLTIGETKLLDKKYVEAIESFKKALIENPEMVDIGIAIAMYDIAKCYNFLGQADSTKKYGLAAIQLFEPYKQEPVKRECYYESMTFVIDAAISQKDRKLAERWLNQKANDTLESGWLAFYYKLDQLAFALYEKDFEAAESFLNQAQTINRTQLRQEAKLEVISARIEYYTAIGDYKKALEFTTEKTAFQDSVREVTRDLKTAAYETLLEIERFKIREDALSESNKQLAEKLEAEQKYARQFKITTFLGAAFIVVFLMMLVNRQKSKKKVEKLYLENLKKNVQLSEAYTDLEILQKEANHRIKNNFHLIALFLDLQKAEVPHNVAAIDAINTAKRKLLAMSKVHEMLLAENYKGKIRLDEYLGALLAELNENLNPNLQKIQLDLMLDHVLLPDENTVRLGLFVQEVVSNAYEHAFVAGQEGKITVNLKNDENTITLEIADNGVGFHHTNTSTGMGLEILQLVAKQLDAALETNTTNGVSYKLKIKKH